MRKHILNPIRSMAGLILVSLSIIAAVPYAQATSTEAARRPAQTSMPRPGGNAQNGHKGGNSLDRPGSNGDRYHDRNRREAEKLMRKADEWQRKADRYRYEASECLRSSERYRREAQRYADFRDYRNADRADRQARKEYDRYLNLNSKAQNAQRQADDCRRRATHILR